MTLITVPLFLPSLATGCASVIADYEAARDLAMTPADAAPDDWVPDATVQLSKPLLDDLMTQAMSPPPVFDDELDVGFAVLTPALTLETLKFAPSSSCVECLTVELNLGGDIAWDAPIIGKSSAGVKVGGRIDAALSVSPAEGGFALAIEPRDIHDVGVEIMGTRAAIDIGGPIVGWVESTVFGQIPQIPITEITSDMAPIRGLRVSSSGQAVRIDLLTGARAGGALPQVMPFPVDGFQVDVSTASLLAMAKAEAFKAGPMTRGILAEPTKLDFEGDQFAIGLRLWKTTGRGFWRDYEVTGTWKVEDGELTMAPDKVHDRGHSRGAALADPLVALGEGLIQRAIGNAMDTTMPTRSGQLGGISSELVVNAAEASGGILRIHGVLEAIPQAYGPPSPEPSAEYGPDTPPEDAPQP